ISTPESVWQRESQKNIHHAQPLPSHHTLLLIDNQSAFQSTPTSVHRSRANPQPGEKSLTVLLTAFRTTRAKQDSNSHNPATSHLQQQHRRAKPVAIASTPHDDDEPVLWKHVNSAFIGMELESHAAREDSQSSLLLPA
ncbi:hypothetical protein RJZ90_006906, partial [Blastomyces dermatitidis]